MKNLKLFLSVVFVLLLFNSCENEEDLFVDDPSTDIEINAKIANESANRGPTITFGRYFGKCQGNSCVEIFRLIEFTLLEDVLDNYPSSQNSLIKNLNTGELEGKAYVGDFRPFKGSDKIKTSDILPNFPLELLDSKIITYGTPDAGDWGGIYLEYQDGLHHRYWFLDLKNTNNPKHLREYVNLIDKKITEIGEINNLN